MASFFNIFFRTSSIRKKKSLKNLMQTTLLKQTMQLELVLVLLKNRHFLIVNHNPRSNQTLRLWLNAHIPVENTMLKECVLLATERVEEMFKHGTASTQTDSTTQWECAKPATLLTTTKEETWSKRKKALSVLANMRSMNWIKKLMSN